MNQLEQNELLCRNMGKFEVLWEVDEIGSLDWIVLS